jgi:hypothetical protein
MTSPKQLVSLSGAVEQVNAKGTGIKFLGEWLNISQYHPITPMPTPGELVEVVVETTDRGQWINSLKIVGASTAGPSTSMNRDHAIAKMSALRSAAIYCGHRSTVTEDAKSSDVLKIAEAWLKWLEQPNAEE